LKANCFEGKRLDEENEERTVALPCDSVRKRMELVGFLLHPVPRSETWRSLSFFQAERVFPALRDPRTLLKMPGRRAELEEKSASDNEEIIRENAGFLKPKF
jgi:hypothetical protein